MASSNIEMQMGKEPTIKEFIQQYFSEDILSSKFFLKQVFETNNGKKMLVNASDLVIKYLPELEVMKVKVTMSDEEYAKYKYNPKYLSYDIYGTTELWFLILEANEMHSAMQFNFQTIYLYTSDIVEKMGRILNLENIPIAYNEEEISESLNN